MDEKQNRKALEAHLNIGGRDCGRIVLEQIKALMGKYEVYELKEDDNGVANYGAKKDTYFAVKGFWECCCSKNYIHKTSTTRCSKCKTSYLDGMEARLSDVLEYLVKWV